MWVHKILLIIILLAAVFSAYAVQDFWKKKIDARRSLGQFILFMFVNLLSVFVLVFIFGFLIIHFKDFFFKR